MSGKENLSNSNEILARKNFQEVLNRDIYREIDKNDLEGRYRKAYVFYRQAINESGVSVLPELPPINEMDVVTSDRLKDLENDLYFYYQLKS